MGGQGALERTRAWAIGKLEVCENGLGEPGGLQGTQGWGRWSTLETADYILRTQMG